MVYVTEVCWQLASEQAVSKPIWHIQLLCVQWKTPDDGQRNCRKHVEFYSKNKFKKSVHLVGFIIKRSVFFFGHLLIWGRTAWWLRFISGIVYSLIKVIRNRIWENRTLHMLVYLKTLSQQRRLYALKVICCKWHEFGRKYPLTI